MQIGAMNHPAKEVLSEIDWMAELGFDFIDLTLEPPRAECSEIDLCKIREKLKQHTMGVVGHTAYYLPIAHPFKSVRKAAVEELKRCIESFAFLGVRWMNLHPDRFGPFQEKRTIYARNIESLNELVPHARNYGMGLMLENLPGDFNSATQLGALLDPLPEVGLHLDIGHSNLLVSTNSTEEILAVYGTRLRHVHVHDNKGGSADLHLPLGAGTMDLPRHIKSLRNSGYDGTITLEVFSADRFYAGYSREILRKIWEDVS